AGDACRGRPRDQRGGGRGPALRRGAQEAPRPWRRACRRLQRGDGRLHQGGDPALAQGHPGRERHARQLGIGTGSEEMNAPLDRRTWPASLTRVPYWVYQDEANYREELRRIFEGPVWNYACLESDVASPGDYRTTWVGEMPVVVVRADDGEV